MPHTNSDTKEKYYQLGCDLGLNSGYVKKQINNSNTLIEGKLEDENKLILPWLITIKPNRHELAMIDYYSSEKLMSKRLVEAIQSAGVNNLQLFPAEIKNTQTDEIVRDYYVVNIIGLVSGADEDSSASLPLAGSLIFDKPVIDPRKTEGLLIFRLQESILTVIVYERVARAIEEGNFKGVTVKPVITSEIFSINKSQLHLATKLQKEKEPNEFLALLQDIPENVNDLEFTHLVTAYIYNHLVAVTRTEDYDTGKKLVFAYASLLKKIGRSDKYADEFAATAVSLAQLSKDKEVESITFNQLMPLYITHPRLAFNLACFYAVEGEKKTMLQYIRIALDLGKEKEEFLKDSDFNAFRNDPEFRAVLGIDTT